MARCGAFEILALQMAGRRASTENGAHALGAALRVFK
jgi:hypothetical protein